MGNTAGASLSVATFSTAGCRVPRNPRHPPGPCMVAAIAALCSEVRGGGQFGAGH